MFNLVIGVDISKSTLDASAVRFGNLKVKHDSFLNRSLGFKQLLKGSLGFKEPEDQLLICMEHTGHYAHQFVTFLRKKSISVALINPLKIKRSMGLRREKSDKADSKVIAMYGLKFQEELQINNLTDNEFLELQLLLTHRKRIQEKSLGFKVQTNHLKDCLSNAFAKQIARDLLRFKKYFDKELKIIEERIDKFIESNPHFKHNYELLLSIPGVGRIISLYTILHTRNFTQITCSRKFACYCGVAPFKNESGSSIRKGTRVSFFANRKLKGILNFGAMNAVRSDPQLKAYYQKKTAEKGNKMLVLNAVRNKLIHRMFAVIRRGTPYVVSPAF